MFDNKIFSNHGIFKSFIAGILHLKFFQSDLISLVVLWRRVELYILEVKLEFIYIYEQFYSKQEHNNEV